MFKVDVNFPLKISKEVSPLYESYGYKLALELREY